MDEIDLRSAATLARQVRDRSLSPTRIVSASLERIERLNPGLNAFLTVDAEGALSAARAAERWLDAGGELPPLLGVPIAVKDAEVTRGLRTTFGSRVFRDHVPDRDTVHVERLRRAGAIVVGKTNTPEFTLLGETRNLLGAECVNPHDPTRSPGGSSGGSAAAVAAGLVPLATGTDTAGSITLPSAFCGVFGLKPTHRRIPVWPNADDWPLLYDVGPITNDVADAALSLALTAGWDARDPYALTSAPPDYLGALRGPLGKLRIAWTGSIAGLPVEPVCREAVERLAGLLGDLGHDVRHACPQVEPPGEIIETLGNVEESAIRGRLLAQPADRLHPETLSVLRAGAGISGEAYARALHRMQVIRSAFNAFFLSHDLLIAPATACPAFPLGRPPRTIDGRPVPENWIGFAPFNMYANLAGLPVASLPVERTVTGLPLGVLIFGAFDRDAQVLAFARALETAGLVEKNAMAC